MFLTDDQRPDYSALMRTEIVIPAQITPSLNRTMNEHFSAKTKRRMQYEKHIWAATRHQHPGPVRLEIYRHSPGLLDADNFIGGLKSLIDALKNRKVIQDDTNQVLQQQHYEQVQIERNGPKMMVIVITDLPT